MGECTAAETGEAGTFQRFSDADFWGRDRSGNSADVSGFVVFAKIVKCMQMNT